jgi:hypothetical protein
MQVCIGGAKRSVSTRGEAEALTASGAWRLPRVGTAWRPLPTLPLANLPYAGSSSATVKNNVPPGMVTRT